MLDHVRDLWTTAEYQTTTVSRHPVFFSGRIDSATPRPVSTARPRRRCAGWSPVRSFDGASCRRRRCLARAQACLSWNSLTPGRRLLSPSRAAPVSSPSLDSFVSPRDGPLLFSQSLSRSFPIRCFPSFSHTVVRSLFRVLRCHSFAAPIYISCLCYISPSHLKSCPFCVLAGQVKMVKVCGIPLVGS